MKNIDIDDVIKRHLAGENLFSIAKIYGVKSDTLKERLKRINVPITIKSPKDLRVEVPVTQIINLFKNGMSVKCLAKKFSVSRGVINRRLRNNNIIPRDRSESMFNRMKNTPKTERQRISEKAHAAVKGRKYSREELRNRAISRQMSFTPNKFTSRWERMFYEFCIKSKLPIIPQFAIEKYNVDFRIDKTPFVVEIFGAHWKCVEPHPTIFLERSKCFRKHNFITIVIWADDRNPISIGCIDKIQSLVNEFSRDKSVFREQYVILGDGNITSRGQDKIKYLSGIISFGY